MAAILSTIDVEDLATPKVRAYKDALTELLEVQERMQRAAASGAVGAGLDALGGRVANVKAASQAFREIRDRIAQVGPPLQQLTSATANYLIALRGQATAQQEVANSIAIWGGALGGLAQNLRANIQLTQQEAAALKELAQASAQGGGFTAEQAQSLALLNAKVEQGLPLLAQDLRLLSALSEQYAVANREVLGLGTATSTLLTNQRQQQAALQGTIAGLSALNTELRGGAAASALQVAAFGELTETVSALTAVTDADKAAMAALVAQIKEGAALTPIQVAELQRLIGALTAATQARQADTSAIQQLLQAEQASLATLAAQDAQTREYAAALSLLGNQLRADTVLTEQQVAVLSELSAASKTNTTFTQEQAAALARYAQVAQTKGALDEQEIQHLRALAQGYTQANREALGLASATEQLIAAQQTEAAQIQINLRGLQILNAQLKEGSRVTAQQAAAAADLAQRASRGQGFSDAQAASAKRLSTALQEGSLVTRAHAQEMKGLVTSYEASTRAAQQQVTALGGLKLEMLGLLVALTTLAAGTTAYLKSSVDLAARVETLGIVMAVTAKNAHLSNQEMLLQVESIKRLGITTQEATSAVLQFVQADLKLSDSAKLARVAQDLAVVAGINSSQAFQRLLAAINTQQPELLRTFGIVTGVQQAMQKYAQEIGKTVRQLDPLDRKQAILNLVLVEGAKVTGSYEASMTTAGKQMGSMARLTEELSLKTGQQLMPIFTLLVGILFRTLEALNGMGPAFFATVAGVTAVIAIMTTFQVLMVTGVIPSLKTLSVFLLTPGWGTVVLLIGAAAAALVYFTKQISLNIDGLTKQGAASESLVTSLKTQEAKVLSLQQQYAAGKVTLQELENAYVSLNKTVPGVIDNINGKWQVNLGLVEEEIKRQEALQRTLYATAIIQLGDLEKQQKAAKARLDSSQNELNMLERIQAARAKGENIDVPNRFKGLNAAAFATQVDTVRAKNVEWAKSTEALTAQLLQLTGVVDSMGEHLDPAKAKIGAYNRAIASLAEANAKFGGERVAAELAKINIAISAITKTADIKTLTDFLEALDKVTKSIEEQERKSNALKQRREQALESALQSIRGDSVATVASLQAANTAFGEVAKGSDEYRARLERGSSAIAAFNKLSEEQQKKYKNVAEAAKEFQRIELDKLFEQWSISGQKAANELSLAFGKTFLELQQGFRTAAREQDNQLLTAREDLNDKIYNMDRDNYERLVVSRMKGVDQEVYAENKRVEDLLRGVERERRARDRALQEEEVRQNERFDLIRQEMLLRSQAAMQELSLQQQVLEASLASQVADPRSNMTQQRADEQLAAFMKVRREIVLQIQKDDVDRLATINKEQQKNRTLLEDKRRFYRESDEIEDAALRRTIDASGETVRRIRDQYDEVKNFIQDVFGGAIEAAASGFARMLTFAENWRDGFKGILSSVKQAFFSFVDSMVKKWVTEGITNMLGRGPAGQPGGMSGLLSGFKGLTDVVKMARAGSVQREVSGVEAQIQGTSKLAPWAQQAVAYGGTALASGYAGYAVGSQFNTRTKGALAGAAVGAGTGAMIGTFVFPGIGTAIGAGIGAIAGAIGGLIGGGKEAREVKKFRDELITVHGGIEKLKKEAAEAGLNIDKMLSTKKMKEFQVEAMKLDLVLQFSSLDELRKRAQLAGVDIDAMFRISKAEDFKKAVDALNVSLAEQQKRLAGLKTAGEGLTLRSTGFVEGIQKDLNTIYAEMGATVRTKLETAFELAVKRGFSGDRTQFMIEQLQRVAEGAPNMLGLPADSIAKFRALLAGTQEDFDRLGTIAVGTFAQVIRETGDLNAALEAVGPTLDILLKAEDTFGLHASVAVQKLLDFRKVLAINSDVAKSLSGITQVLKGLIEAKALNQDLFSAISQDVVAQRDKLLSRGATDEQALLAVQPVLQQLYEAQKKYHFSIDASTQALIDQAKQQGLVGDQFKAVNEKILDVLLAIAHALHATIPEALDTFADATSNATGSAYDDFNQVAYGNSPGGVRGIVTQLQAATTAVGTFADVTSQQMAVAQRTVDAAADAFNLHPELTIKVPPIEVPEVPNLPPVTVNIEDAQQQLQTLSGVIGHLPTGTVALDTGVLSAAQLKADDLRALLTRISNKWTIGLNADAAAQALDDLKKKSLIKGAIDMQATDHNTVAAIGAKIFGLVKQPHQLTITVPPVEIPEIPEIPAIEVPVSAETAIDQVGQLQDQLQAVSETPVTVTLATQAAQAEAARVSGILSRLSGRPVTIPVEAVTKEAEKELGIVQGMLGHLPTGKVALDVGQAVSGAAHISGLLAGLTGRKHTIPVDAVTKAAQEEFSILQRMIGHIKPPMLDVRPPDIQPVLDQLDLLPDTVPVDVPIDLEEGRRKFQEFLDAIARGEVLTTQPVKIPTDLLPPDWSVITNAPVPPVDIAAKIQVDPGWARQMRGDYQLNLDAIVAAPNLDPALSAIDQVHAALLADLPTTGLDRALQRVQDQLATMPAAFGTMGDAALAAGQVAEASMTRVALGSSPGGVREIVSQLFFAKDAMQRFRDQVAQDSTGVDADATDMAQRFSSLIPGADGLVDRLIGQDRVPLRPPSEVVPPAAGVLTGAIGAGAPGDADAPTDPVPMVLLQVENNFNIDAAALDGQDMLRVYVTQIEPLLVSRAEANTAQVASALEAALAKYRSRTP